MTEENRDSESEETAYAWCIVRRSWMDDRKPLLLRRYVSPLVGKAILPLIFLITNFMILYLGIGELLFPGLSLNPELEIIRKKQEDNVSKIVNLDCKLNCSSVYDMEELVVCSNVHLDCILHVLVWLTGRNYLQEVFATNNNTNILVVAAKLPKHLDMLCSLSEFAVFYIQVIGLFLSNILIFHCLPWVWKVERSRTLWNVLLGLSFMTSRLGYYLWYTNSPDLSLIRFWFYLDIFLFIFLINKTGEYSPLSVSLTGHFLILFIQQIENVPPNSFYRICVGSLLLTLASMFTVRLYSVQHYAVFITPDWKSFWKMHFGYDGDDMACLEATIMPVQGYDIMWKGPCGVGSAFREGDEILRSKFQCPNFESMKEDSVRFMKNNPSFSCYTSLSSNCIFFAQTLFEHLTHKNGSMFFRKQENWETYPEVADLKTMASASTVPVPSTSLTLYDRITRAILGVCLCLKFTNSLGVALYIIYIFSFAKYFFLALHSVFSLPLKATNFVFRKLFCDRNDCWSCRDDWGNSLMTELKHRIPVALMILVLPVLSTNNAYAIIVLLSHAVYHFFNGRLPGEINSLKDLLIPFVIAIAVSVVFVSTDVISIRAVDYFVQYYPSILNYVNLIWCIGFAITLYFLLKVVCE